MNSQASTELIVEIERCFDVNQVRYRDLTVWPLVRNAIRWQLLYPEQNHTRLGGPPRPVPRFGVPAMQIRALKQLRDTDFVFYTIAQNNTDRIQGRFYDRYTDPMIDLVRDRHGFLKIEMDTPPGRKKMPRYEPTLLIGPPQAAPPRPGPSRPGRIEGFGDLARTVEAVTGMVRLDEALFLQQARLVEEYRDFFLALLDCIGPKAVFFPWYYNPPAMGLTWACRDLGAVSVEVQHGKQGRYHGMYTHWTRIPENGYPLVPDLFWNWGRDSRANIERHRHPGVRHHRPIVGGNRWLGLWVEDGGFPGSPEERAFIDSLQEHAKVVLVTLQRLPDPIPRPLIQAVLDSPSDWFWLFRLHPLQTGQEPAFMAMMRKYGVSGFEMHMATRCPLYMLFRHTDHHVTGYSSTCFEAKAFGVPTTLIHPEALASYREYIGQGLFEYATSGQDILAQIRRADSGEAPEHSGSYIEARRETAIEALAAVLKRAEEIHPEKYRRVGTPGQRHPEALALAQQGYSLLEAGRPDLARASFARALTLEAPGPGLYYGLAQALVRTGFHQEAAEAAARELDIQPGHPGARNLLAGLLRSPEGNETRPGAAV
ncbi:MAG: hypothetical protein KKB20_07190 [Proteobacteria bacterium]|nr:hypothetical protein [Pseudomonadota bacterium]